MRKKLAEFIVAGCIVSCSCLVPLALSTGCATTSQTTLTAAVAKIIARRGTVEAIRYKPEYKPGFIAAKVVLDAVVALNSPTKQDLVDAIQKLPANELKGDEGALLIADVRDLVGLLTQNFNDLDVSGLQQIVLALDQGMTEGLDALSVTVPAIP
jgi:hypothetical protein